MCSWSELVKISTQRQLEKTIWCFLARDSHRNRLDVSWPETDKKKKIMCFLARDSHRNQLCVFGQRQLEKLIMCFLIKYS